jgi:4,5-DOPA dioxygenase extradiol
MISAHWFINASAVTAMERPRTIHDFYGFPKELFEIQYPAPGAPTIAEEVVEALKPEWIGLDRDTWGLDHGTWSVLAHAFPAADIPVLQLAMNSLKPIEYHLELGARLAQLQKRGVMILASGNVVHNLRRIDWNQPDGAFDWNRRFDNAVKDVMTTRPGDIIELQSHPDYQLAVPTPEHFLPLVYFAGLVAATSTTAEVLVEGFSLGSLSMTAYTAGLHSHSKLTGRNGSAPLAEAPPEQTNV